MTGEHWETTRSDQVEIYLSGSGWRFRVQAPNGEIVEQGEAYFHRADAVDAALRHHPRIGTPDD